MSYNLLPAQKIIDSYKRSLSVMRTGRVNASILENITVEAYGDRMPIQSIATVNVPENAQLLITPFDKSLNNAIEKAIIDANIGVNPVNDGAGIRLIFPPMTEETRKLRVKEVYKDLEESRIAARNTRQDLLRTQKVLKENGNISEDELKRYENDLQKEVDNLNKELEEIAKAKEAEIMKI
jgi:ribosome recycling factor